METSNEQKLVELLDNITINYKNQDENNTLVKKTQKYNECVVMIKEAKRLIEELKIEIINMDNGTQTATPAQISETNTLIELVQISGSNFDDLKQIIESLRHIHNTIPTETTIIDNIENDICYEDEEEEMEIK